jgi:hypothetical protein
MATVDKNFRVKNGLNVAGNATFDSQVILGTTPLAFDTTTNRLQVYVNNAWASIATLDDFNNQLSFMDIGLAIDYDGQPTYIVQANGVTPSGTSKFMDGGSPSLTTFDITFDAGVI